MIKRIKDLNDISIYSIVIGIVVGLIFSFCSIFILTNVDKIASSVKTSYCFPLPADDSEDSIREYNKLIEEKERENQESELSARRIIYSISAVLGCVGIWLLVGYGMICIKKIANRQKGEDNFKTSLRTFDPAGLSGTTTPLSGSPYGNSQEVSVTSPLNNGFYFEIVEELSFLGSNEIIS